VSREIKRANKRKECKEQTNGKTKGPYVIFFRDRDVKFVNFFCAQVVFHPPFLPDYTGIWRLHELILLWLVVWNMTFIFHNAWECHNPNWLIFFRGVGWNMLKPPTSSIYFIIFLYSSRGFSETCGKLWESHPRPSRPRSACARSAAFSIAHVRCATTTWNVAPDQIFHLLSLENHIYPLVN
jgi:hypothetical protein